MTIFQALILGITQGLTEFLPVSSSAHLVDLPQLLGWAAQPLVFDTTLHLGTAAALILFFWQDLFKYYLALLKDMLAHRFIFGKYSRESRFAFYLLISTIPATIIGLLFNEFIETYFRGLISTAVTLIFGSVLMIVAEKYFAKNSTGDILQKMTVKKSLIIGSFQTLALFPGVSRSGSTISSGMYMGLSREEAARFSFLASVPIVLEAGIYQLIKSPDQILGANLITVLVGFVASFLVGLLVIRFLLKFLRSKSLNVFIAYRLVLAGFLLLIVFFR